MSFINLKDIIMSFINKKNINTDLANYSPITAILDGKFPIAEKVERLTTAVYLVTSNLSDSEPAKWEIKNESLVLLNSAISLSDMSFPETARLELFRSAIKIVSILEVLGIGGSISVMNFLVLKKEFENLIVFLDKLKGSDQLERETIPEGLLGKQLRKSVKYGAADERKNLKDKAIFSKGQVSILKDNKLGMSFRDETLSDDSSFIKDKNSRAEIIKKTLQNGKSFTVNDFLEIIPGFSKKTILRELVSLMNVGVLKREGNRRWSKYSLADAKVQNVQDGQ